MVGWIKVKLGMVVRLGPGHIVLDGDPARPKWGTAPPPQLSAYVCCSQTARWIKMPLGMEVGLGPGDIVLDGDPAPSSKGGTAAPQFSVHVLWPNGWMDQDATWYRGSFPTRKKIKGHSPPIFGPCVLWPNCRLSQLLLSSCLHLLWCVAFSYIRWGPDSHAKGNF